MSTAEGGGNGRAGAVRVVIISTQYIETDAANFKSVVQRLTGKDSHHIYHKPTVLPRLSPPPFVSQVAAGSTKGANNVDSSSDRVSLISDLDRLHTLPSWEEISRLCIM